MYNKWKNLWGKQPKKYMCGVVLTSCMPYSNARISKPRGKINFIVQNKAAFLAHLEIIAVILSSFHTT